MTQPFTPEQSREIDDRIVEKVVAVMGEGQYSRRCRAIANERALEIEGVDRADGEVGIDGAAAQIRLECLRLVMTITGRDPQRAIDLAAVFERQVTMGFKVSMPPSDADPAPLPLEENGPLPFTPEQDDRVRAIAKQIGSESAAELRAIAEAAVRSANRDRRDRRG